MCVCILWLELLPHNCISRGNTLAWPGGVRGGAPPRIALHTRLLYTLITFLKHEKLAKTLKWCCQSQSFFLAAENISQWLGHEKDYKYFDKMDSFWSPYKNLYCVLTLKISHFPGCWVVQVKMYEKNYTYWSYLPNYLAALRISSL